MLKSIVETSKILGISEVSLRRLVRFRRISYRKIGDRILFSEADINAYMESVKVAAIEEAANV